MSFGQFMRRRGNSFTLPPPRCARHLPHQVEVNVGAVFELHCVMGHRSERSLCKEERGKVRPCFGIAVTDRRLRGCSCAKRNSRRLCRQFMRFYRNSCPLDNSCAAGAVHASAKADLSVQYAGSYLTDYHYNRTNAICVIFLRSFSKKTQFGDIFRGVSPGIAGRSKKPRAV